MGACLFLLLLLPSPALAVDRGDDVFLAGYLTSVLEQVHGWETDSYVLHIDDGVGIITLFVDDELRRKSAEMLNYIDGVKSITVNIGPKDPPPPEAIPTFLGVTGKSTPFPTGDLFSPLIADPKQAQFFVSIDYFDTTAETYTMASVGFGENFGLVRYLGGRVGNGLQLSVQGALFAQFNLETPSADLINADYTIGLPLSYRYGSNSLRLRFYHQSSHLGDELLQQETPPERINLSFEALELIYSFDWRNWRAYGGGEYLVHKEPADLKPASLHLGLEYRGKETLLWNGRPIGGIDLKSLEEHNWARDISVKLGLEFGHPNPGQRRLRLIAEWYQGYDPRGQFYHNKVQYLGLGTSLAF